ncbi:transglycosylase SLT domain-containing protein [Streptomyces sp. NBC_00140]|uniref:transglycosylase SLT domain-containing protein n=1 Tax=Streptomyces sp. NBC_00140 TaxID=2975664 RepID=UPI00225A2116|nr:transglycosylase SLT domain-containing protein [Streptomyces sp. NBC_00140]MCX5335199.1 transglycosylase SLT domain-containing protein [Streptomyces sp. NBC_00140]
MSKKSHSRALTKRHKVAIAGVATLGAAALAFSAVPSNAETTTSEAASAKVAYSSEQLKGLRSDVTEQLAATSLQAQAAEAAAAKKAAAKAASEAAAKKKAAAEAAAKKKAEQERKAKAAASRSAKRATVKAATKAYANNLDGWIKESLDIMKSKGIPGTYNGLYRNIIRESSGNPNAINNWDVNAVNGTPSIGLLQIIKPTFDAYHVSGTPFSQYDPVANIVASANYAADKYGSIDNVNGAY